VGFSNILKDTDNVVRRHYLALTPPPASPCQAAYSLSVQLALRYLFSQGIQLEFTPEGVWQLGKLRFQPLEAHTGGYQGIDALGHQILLNYRSSPSPNAIAPQITLQDAIAGKLNDAAVKGKIVIIGTTAESFHDSWQTPFISQGNAQEIPGVILQAQMVSQLLSAALDGRPLLWSWSIWGEVMWIWFWSVIGCLLAWYITRVGYLVLTVAIACVVLYSSCLIFLILFSAWIPLVPAVLALGSNAFIVSKLAKNKISIFVS
jgi:CHASE2 domain-containing sensor protein